MAAKKKAFRPLLDTVDPQNLHTLRADDITAGDDYEAVLLSGESSSLDWHGISLSEARVANLSASSDVRLIGGRISETVIERSQITILNAGRSTLRDVHVHGTRIGSADLSGASLRSVRFTDCKLGYVSFRGADLSDVLFERCVIDEVDFYGAKLTRVAFDDTRTSTLSLDQADTQSADLRGLDFASFSGMDGLAGSVMSELQIAMLASTFATHLGVRIEA